MKGKGVASCSILSESGSVSWKTNEFSCESKITTTIPFITAHVFIFTDLFAPVPPKLSLYCPNQNKGGMRLHLDLLRPDVLGKV